MVDIKISINADEALRDLAKIQDQLDEAQKEADGLEQDVSKIRKKNKPGSRAGRPAAGAGGGGGGGIVGKALGIGAAAIATAALVSQIGDVVGRKLEEAGLSAAGTKVRSGAAELTRQIPGRLAGVTGSIRAAGEVGVGLAASGVNLSGDQAGAIVSRFREGVTRDLVDQQRRITRAISAYPDFAKGLLGFGGR